jgi:hypothetical protein
MPAQLENNREWTLAQLKRLETKLMIEFNKPASPAELRRRTRAAVLRVMELEAGLPPIA